MATHKNGGGPDANFDTLGGNPEFHGELSDGLTLQEAPVELKSKRFVIHTS